MLESQVSDLPYYLPWPEVPNNSLPLDHDPHITDWLREYLKPEDVFYDIGANIGLYSAQAAKLGAFVYAFEPLASAAKQIPHHPHITVVPVAVWREQASLEFVLTYDSQHTEVNLPVSEAYPVYFHRTGAVASAVTLAHIVRAYPPPNVLKSDTQGCEAAILAGALGSHALSECRVLILERDGECLGRHGYTVDDLDALVLQSGFRIEGSIKGDILCVR